MSIEGKYKYFLTLMRLFLLVYNYLLLERPCELTELGWLTPSLSAKNKNKY